MIEFIEEGHIYLVDGVITPSVSDLIKFIFPDKYDGVPENILNKKAEFGTIVHKAVECFEKQEKILKLNTYQKLCLEEYKLLKEKHNIIALEQEIMVNYENKYCGRFDMIANIENEYCLCDIKTTAELDTESISWQLSYYALAYAPEDYENKFKKFYAIWLPKKDVGKLVEIKKKSKKELLDKLKEYEKINNIFNNGESMNIEESRELLDELDEMAKELEEKMECDKNEQC